MDKVGHGKFHFACQLCSVALQAVVRIQAVWSPSRLSTLCKEMMAVV